MLPEPLQVQLVAPERVSVDRLRVRFCTPTELKSSGSLVAVPEFGILFARIRDRLSALSTLYGSSTLDVDFQAWRDQADRVKLVDSRLEHHISERLSSRTGQRHSIGGFTGCAEYSGDLGRFLPWLEAAYWTGVGRQTVWGKGEIQIEQVLLP